jgi:hypothetical protein
MTTPHPGETPPPDLDPDLGPLSDAERAELYNAIQYAHAQYRLIAHDPRTDEHTREQYHRSIDTLVRAAAKLEGQRPAEPRLWDTDRFMIWSNEQQRWWRAHGRGYTSYIEWAGLYTTHEALAYMEKSRLGALVQAHDNNGYFQDQLLPKEVMVPAHERWRMTLSIARHREPRAACGHTFTEAIAHGDPCPDAADLDELAP